MRIEIDFGRGVEVVNQLLTLFRQKLPPFDRPEAVLPQDPKHLPSSLELGGVEHRNFLFKICYYMRGGVDSNTAVKLLSKIYDERPEYFDPFFASTQLPIEDLRKALEAVGLNYRKSQNPEFWIENDIRLVERYNGDPGLIFDGVTDYEEACRRIQNDMRGRGFRGFQKKMVSMLAYFLLEAGFIDAFDFPIPVDFHVARLTLSHGIVWVDADADENLVRDEAVLDVVRDFYLWYAKQYKVDPLELSDTMWMYSRLMCQFNPENEWLQRGKKRSGRNTDIVKRIVDWNRPSVQNSWLRSCGTCAVEATCELNIAAMPYYIRGEIKLNDPRSGPPPDLTIIPLATYYRYRSPKAETAPEKPERDPNQLELDLD